jgi:hypothetical protein
MEHGATDVMFAAGGAVLQGHVATAGMLHTLAGYSPPLEAR